MAGFDPFFTISLSEIIKIMWFQGKIYKCIFFHVNVALSTKHLYPFLDALKLFQRLAIPKLW